jgi:hypothetical protein
MATAEYAKRELFAFGVFGALAVRATHDYISNTFVVEALPDQSPYTVMPPLPGMPCRKVH